MTLLTASAVFANRLISNQVKSTHTFDCIRKFNFKPSGKIYTRQIQVNRASQRYYRVTRSNNGKKRDPLAMGAPTPQRAAGSESIGMGGYFMLIIPVTTFCLGVWQVKRWFWKLDLIAAMEKKTSARVPFQSLNVENIDDYEYNTVTVKGTFLPGSQLLLGPRSLHNPSSGEKQREGGGLISQGSQSGYNIITPFKVSGQDTILLVNRGWIPHKTTVKFEVDENGQEVEIAGVVRKDEKRSPFMSKTQPGSRLWLYRDVESMAQLLGTSEIFLDLVSTGSNKKSTKGDNYPIPGQTRVTLRNEHVSYFLTWFSLSGITSYLWFRQFKQRLPLK